MTKRIKKGAAAVVEDIPHEDITGQTGDGKVQKLSTAVLVLTAEQKAEQEIKRFEIARAWISDRKEQYKGLKIASLEDKEGYRAVEKAWQEIRNKRLLVQKKHTEIKADYLVITRAIDGEKNELVRLLTEVETPLATELDRIENEKREIEQAKERAAQEKLQGRVAELIANGMAFNGKFYAIGETISMDVVTLKDFEDADYDQLLSRVKAENERIENAKAEAKRIEDEEKQRVEDQRLENERQAIALREGQEKLANAEKVAKELRIKMRSKLLQSMGMVYDYVGTRWHFTTPDCGHIEIGLSVVETGEDEDFNTASDVAETQIAKLKQSQAEKDEEKRLAKAKEDERQQVIGERIMQLQHRFGMQLTADKSLYYRESGYKDVNSIALSVARVNDSDGEKWAEILADLGAKYTIFTQQETAAIEAEKQQKETERQAALSDVQKAREWLEKILLNLQTIPQFSADNIADVVLSFKNKTETAMRELNGKLRDFEK
jgi:hypothetical protein